MRSRWMLGLVLTAGCAASAPPKVTQQVPAAPFNDARAPIMQTRATYAPATQDTQERVQLAHDKLVSANPKFNLRSYITAIGSADPEIFHTSLKQIFITEGLVRQCVSDELLVAVLANEMGRIVSEREAATSQETRQPAPLPPMYVPIGGNGNSQEADPLYAIEMARYEKQYPRRPKTVPPPNPQQVARTILESAGYQRTMLDAAMPILQNADRYRALQSQFKGAAKQSDWKTP